MHVLSTVLCSELHLVFYLLVVDKYHMVQYNVCEQVWQFVPITMYNGSLSSVIDILTMLSVFGEVDVQTSQQILHNN